MCRDAETQFSGWAELWDSDQDDLWDRGKPSPALIDLLESKYPAASFPSVERRPRALVPVCMTSSFFRASYLYLVRDAERVMML